MGNEGGIRIGSNATRDATSLGANATFVHALPSCCLSLSVNFGSPSAGGVGRTVGDAILLLIFYHPGGPKRSFLCGKRRAVNGTVKRRSPILLVPDLERHVAPAMNRSLYVSAYPRTYREFREPTSGLEPLCCSLRVISHALHEFA
jgi:hypothetical protein